MTPRYIHASAPQRWIVTRCEAPHGLEPVGTRTTPHDGIGPRVPRVVSRARWAIAMPSRGLLQGLDDVILLNLERSVAADPSQAPVLEAARAEYVDRWGAPLPDTAAVASELAQERARYDAAFAAAIGRTVRVA